jgi:FecR protein
LIMHTRAIVFLAFVFPIASHLSAQSVISARSGLINFSEGVAFVDGQPLPRKVGTFTRLKEGSTLVTESGRVEVLLTPNTYLRIGEKSSIRMISDSLSDTRVELLGGSAVLDSERAPAGDFVKIIFRDATIRILKPGHYRMDAEPPQLRVYAGEAEVARNQNQVTIKSSQLFPLDGAPVVKRFTEGSDGLLDLWSAERGALVASRLTNAQTITDPLLDSGPGVPADLSAWIGYVPAAPAPPLTARVYGGYGLQSPYLQSPYLLSPYLMYPYPGVSISAFAPLISPGYSRYVSRFGYPAIFSNRALFPGNNGIPPRLGPARLPIGTLTAPRPALPAGPVLPPRIFTGAPAPINRMPAPIATPRGAAPQMAHPIPRR